MTPDQTTQAILYVIVVLIFAKLFGEFAERLKQPAVLGELIAGVILGGSVLGWIRINTGHSLPPQLAVLTFLAELGVILLLFEVGLDSDLEEFLRVGPSAFLVATIGVIGPFAAGYLVSSLVFHVSTIVSVFIGATLTATSVGITARTLSDLNQLHTKEAKIILGAAVIDDVLGLIILAVVSGMVSSSSGSISLWEIGKTALLAVVFLLSAIIIGIRITPFLLKVAKSLYTRGMITISAFLFCLALSWIAHEIHLATIVGAFAAGLILAKTEDQAHIRHRIEPVADIFIPIFFVMLGLSVNIAYFNPFNPEARSALSLTGTLILVAIVMKVISGLGVLGRGVKKLVVGVGMIPRGEVGLIFASLGLSRGIITVDEYAGIIAVIIVTTFITPPLLKAVFSFHRRSTA
ncbi:MAG TPA: cation:proton antiporter [Armatimonadota bacterium]|nr:cation:proton antiporter [Armatimonadota bacterium]